MSEYMTREDILTIEDLEEETLEVPAWKNRKVCIMELTAGDRDWFETSLIADAQSGKFTPIKVGKATDEDRNEIVTEKLRSKLCAISIIDPKTKLRLFKQTDVEILSKKSSKAINFIADAIMKLNGMAKEDVEALKKDLGRIRDAASATDSPENSATLSDSSIVDLPPEI